MRTRSYLPASLILKIWAENKGLMNSYFFNVSSKKRVWLNRKANNNIYFTDQKFILNLKKKDNLSQLLSIFNY